MEIRNKFKPPMSSNRKPLHELLPLKVPLSIYLDTSNACNFKCDFCFRNYLEENEVPGELMSFELFKKILGDIKELVLINNEKVKMLHMNGIGEPLLNNKFAEMLKAIKDNECVERVCVTTNGILLTRELSESIIENGLDQIHISIYGLTNEAYKTFTQRDIDFEKFYTNIKYLHQIKKQCHMHIKIAGEYFTEDEKDEFLSKFTPYCDSIYIDSAQDTWPDIVINKSKFKDKKKNEHMYGMDIGKERICPNPFYQILIHSDGVVSPCCVDYKKSASIGDLKEDSLINIWMGNKLQQLRKEQIQRDYNEFRMCAKCEHPNVASTVDITPYKENLIKIYSN